MAEDVAAISRSLAALLERIRAVRIGMPRAQTPDLASLEQSIASYVAAQYRILPQDQDSAPRRLEAERLLTQVEDRINAWIQDVRERVASGERIRLDHWEDLFLRAHAGRIQPTVDEVVDDLEQLKASIDEVRQERSDCDRGVE